MGKVYRKGFLEAVTFCFYRDGAILLEDRGQGFGRQAVIPSGAVETEDKGGDYRKNALLREIDEEMQSQILPVKYDYLGEIASTDPRFKVIFHLYLIGEWQGDFPSHIVEPGEKDSEIRFFSLDEAEKIITRYDTSCEMIRRVRAFTHNEKAAEDSR